MSVWLWILVVVVAVAVAVVVTAIIVRRRDARKVTFAMDALEDGEMNFHFKENTRLNRALNRIRGIFERRSAVDETKRIKSFDEAEMVSKPAFMSTSSAWVSASLNEARGATVFMISCVITRKSLLHEFVSSTAERLSKMPRMRFSARLSRVFSLK